MENIKNEIIKAFNFREATKEFKVDEKIKDEDFNFILETGRLSPSSFGWEPWKFLVLQNKEIREKIKEVAWGAAKQLDTASHFLIILTRTANELKGNSDYLNYITDEIAHYPKDLKDMLFGAFESFKTDLFDLTDDRKIFDWASKQAYIPLANMMSTAAQIGIDSCPIEGFDLKKVEEILINKKILNPEKFGVSVLVAFGYRKENLPWPKSRRKMDEVVEWVK